MIEILFSAAWFVFIFCTAIGNGCTFHLYYHFYFDGEPAVAQLSIKLSIHLSAPISLSVLQQTVGGCQNDLLPNLVSSLKVVMWTEMCFVCFT